MRRGVLAAVGIAAGVATGWWGYKRHRLTRAVAPELRSPFLYLDSAFIPGCVVAPLSVLIRSVNLARAMRQPVEVKEIAGECEGHDFHVRILRPPAAQVPAPAVLWMHGGGHLIGSPAFYDPQNSELAATLGAVVISPYYPKSTQALFPAGLNACYAALRWAQEHAEEMGFDKQRIAIAGDSAGGGLAAAVTQRAFDEGHPVCFQALIYPMLDNRTPDKEGAVGKFMWTAPFNRAAWSSYLGKNHRSEGLKRYAAPGRREDLQGLPPTWLAVGELDLFHDEVVDYARRLRGAGVDTTVEVIPGAYHIFDQIRPAAGASRKMFRHFAEALRTGLEG